MLGTSFGEDSVSVYGVPHAVAKTGRPTSLTLAQTPIIIL